MARQSVEASRPWFVRSVSGWNSCLRPASPAGWLITGLYVAAVAGISLWVLGGEEPGAAELAAWIVLLTAASFAYLLIAYRTAAAVGRAGGCGSGSKAASDPRRTLLLALLSGALVIAAALLGARS